MAIIKNLPKNVNYLYTTEDNFSLCKIYKSKSRIYLDVTSAEGHLIYSYTPSDLQKLSIKFTKYAEIYQSKSEQSEQSQDISHPQDA